MSEERYELVSDRYGEPVAPYTPTVAEFLADCEECDYHPTLTHVGDEWWDEHNERVLQPLVEE